MFSRIVHTKCWLQLMGNFRGAKSGQISMDVKINWPPEPNFISPFTPAPGYSPSLLPSLLNSIVVLTFPIATVPLRLRTVPHWDINIMKHIATTKPSGGKMWATKFRELQIFFQRKIKLQNICHLQASQQQFWVTWVQMCPYVHYHSVDNWIVQREREVRNWN